ncbi:MAG: hypothetical protein B6I36_02510 [Desulfobacteraceae bacterium 4572_35.1]|nr:MAG: hypothetical protein B6I36_02510 [Desulfobacteraceae bacterium 4572_35.1]
MDIRQVRHIMTCFLIPGGLIFLLFATLWQWQPRPELLQTFIHIFPYVVLAFGFFLGCRFQRSRLLLTLLVLTISQKQLIAFLPQSLSEFYLATIQILLPLNLLWLAFVSERNLLSLATAFRVLFIGVQGAMVWIVHHFYATRSWSIIHTNPFSLTLWNHLHTLLTTQIYPLAVASFALTFSIFIAVFIWRPTTGSGAQLWMLCSVLFAQLTTGDKSLFFTATAALILIVVLLEISHSMAFRDELTGLGSRRALNEYLQRLSGVYSLAMVDIDHFKRVNDTHGHDTGDQVLKMVSGCLAQVKGGGRAFRYGGEEFTVVFTGKKVEDSLPHLEALRVKIAQSVFTLRNKPRPKKKPQKKSSRRTNAQTLSVTVSMGVAQHLERKQSTEQVIKQADTALYRAKRKGRNQIC